MKIGNGVLLKLNGSIEQVLQHREWEDTCSSVLQIEWKCDIKSSHTYITKSGGGGYGIILAFHAQSSHFYDQESVSHCSATVEVHIARRMSGYQVLNYPLALQL